MSIENTDLNKKFLGQIAAKYFADRIKEKLNKDAVRIEDRTIYVEDKSLEVPDEMTIEEIEKLFTED